ncbi:TlpA disulfide reductase family protein [Bacteroides sp. 51]|uniref:TlpA disulfide reductase family protein n=1 Tax=Bacteroides sp. 51 TaxID=2302938 RepID=UPI0013D2B7B0|nr:TlpA disulfide reductase family protein [Bacteroides sp. 51]NDV82217.1 AhpC/TSA family protein [Bacteroides sp. 51]
MKKISFLALVVLLLSACNSGSTFTVDGSVADADGKKLYFEASQIDGVVVLDSVKLKGDGSFKFKQPKSESPEFYRLRVEDKVINFSVDSTETVTITAPFTGFTTEYKVAGSPDSEKIKELTLRQMQLQKDMNALFKEAQNSYLDNEVLQTRLTDLLNGYKDEVKVKYIFSSPNTASAYYALFQRANGYLIFDPLSSRDDVKCFGAVATSWAHYYPHATRTKNLTNLAIKGMKNTRAPKEKVLELDPDKISETTLIDIKLKDIKGNVRSLTELKGKVVLLDFTVYQTAISTTHNFWLHDLYDKYADKGLEIYQVSLDADEHYWKTVAGNLPWIGVRDPNGIYSSFAAIYSVQEVPTYFLINKGNELKVRGENVKDIDVAIKGLL